MEIRISCYRKLLVTFGIVLFGFATSLDFFSNKWTIRRGKISVERPESHPVADFYHFSTMRNSWRSIVIEQMTIARLSGLINASSNVYVTGLGNIPDNKNISDIFADSKFIYEYKNNQLDQYEYPTLKKLEKFCFYNNKSFVWYAHSKGASHPVDDVADWRGVMNYFVLDKWQLCHRLLFFTNYTTCGAILTFDSKRKPGWNTYYAGNMWWAKCSHINRLTRIEKLDQKDRYIAELYVTSEPAIGHFNCFFANPHQFQFNKQTASCTVNQPLWNIKQ
jgi:hypothetical protein